MDGIPIFSGEKKELNSWVTWGQFISTIEDFALNDNFMEVEIKEFCLSKLSGTARELFQKNYDKSWRELKTLMSEKFPVKLTIIEKVEVRKGLQQLDNESINDFYQRCLQAQYFVSDDVRDGGFEREVLLHFLIGLSPLIRDLVLATKCSSSDDYINEAKKYVKIIKEEVPEANVKIEIDPYEEFDFKHNIEDFSQCDTYDNYIVSEEILEADIVKRKPKRLNSKSPKTLSESDIGIDEDERCKECNKSFKNTKSLRNHVRNIHSNHKNSYNIKLEGWRKCQICNEFVQSDEILLKHQEKVHGHLKQTCEFCKEVCLTMKILAVHIANKHCTRIPEKGYVCIYCNSVTKKRASKVGYHILNKHFNQPLYECNLCGKGFDEKNGLVSHMKYIHTTEKLFQCDKCAKNFKTVDLLVSHVKNMHEEQETATCRECNKNFKNEKTLRDHFRNMHSGAERTRYMCDDCGKSFLNKQNFQNHSLTHLSKKEIEQLKISCPYPDCDYTTIKKELLDTHNKRVHEKKKDFKCSLCFKSFFTKSKLGEHTNGVHLNVKPFQCEFCQYATAYRTKLHEHNKVAHGNQKYDCPYCNHVARYKGNLDKHINNVHKNLQSSLTQK